MKIRAWIVSLMGMLPVPASALPALQLTRLTGDLEVTSGDRRPARLPFVADGSEVYVRSGRAWFEARAHAGLLATAGDRFIVRRIPSRDAAVEIEALGGSTRLEVRMGRAEVVIRGGAIVALHATRGEGRFEVIRPPVEITSISLGDGETVRVGPKHTGGLGPGDALFVKVSAADGFDGVPVDAGRLQVHVEEKPEGTRIAAAMREAPEPVGVAAADPSAPEGDLRSAVGASPGPAKAPRPAPPRSAPEREEFVDPLIPELAPEELVEPMDGGGTWWLVSAIVLPAVLTVGYLWTRPD